MNWLALSCVLVAPPPATVADATFSQDTQWNAVCSTVRISSDNRDFTTCSGVVIAVREGAAYVLTAAHGAKSTGEYKLEWFTRDKYPLPARQFTATQIGVVLESPTEDISLIKVAVGKDAPPGICKLAPVGARTKEFPVSALVVGCGDGGAPTAQVVQIAGKKLRKKTELDMAFFWETTVPPVSGRSGGPLIDRQGRLIGICAAKGGDLAQKGYYSHLDEIHATLKRNGQEWLIERN
jgi:S1-C subfamily serine protease